MLMQQAFYQLSHLSNPPQIITFIKSQPLIMSFDYLCDKGENS